jgi:CBS domain containing-hemolysin-like protein
MSHRRKKSKFQKWLWRMAFLLLILLLLLMFGYFSMAIDTLVRINNDQIDTINHLQQQIHRLELHTANLQIQNDMMKVKINGIESYQLHNSLHNVTPQIDEQTRTVPHTSLDALKPIPIITVAAMTVVTVLKGIGSLLPTLP